MTFSVPLFLLGLTGAMDFTLDPDGLPAGAVGYVNFVDSTFYTVGGSESIDEVIFSDPEWAYEFVAGDIVAGTGFVGRDVAGFALNGSALAQILAGSTFVMDFTASAGDNARLEFDIFDNPDQNFFWSLTIDSDRVGGTSALGADGLADPPPEEVSLAAHKTAATFDLTTAKCCIDGGVVNSAFVDSGLDTFLEFNYSGVFVKGGMTLRSIAIYPPMSDAEMQAITTL